MSSLPSAARRRSWGRVHETESSSIISTQGSFSLRAFRPAYRVNSLVQMPIKTRMARDLRLGIEGSATRLATLHSSIPTGGRIRIALHSLSCRRRGTTTLAKSHLPHAADFRLKRPLGRQVWSMDDYLFVADSNHSVLRRPRSVALGPRRRRASPFSLLAVREIHLFGG